MRRLIKDLRFIIILSLVITMVIIGLVVYRVESKVPGSKIKSVQDAFWWLLVTISTVGYGDVIPVSEVGRILGGVAIVLGVAFFSVVTGSIASLLVERKILERKGLGKVGWKGHVVILGKNKGLERLLESLAKAGVKEIVLVSDMSEEEFEGLQTAFPELEMRFVKGDFTKDQVLRRAGVEGAATVIVMADESQVHDPDEKTLISILALRTISPSVRIIAEVTDEERGKHIVRAGADEVVGYGEFNHTMLSSYVISPALHDFLKEVLKEGRVGIDEVPRNFAGKKFKELFEHVRRKSGRMVIGLVEEKKGDIVEDILTGDDALDRFIREKLEEAQVDVLSGGSRYRIIMNPPDDLEIPQDATVYIYIS